MDSLDPLDRNSRVCSSLLILEATAARSIMVACSCGALGSPVRRALGDRISPDAADSRGVLHTSICVGILPDAARFHGIDG